MGNIYIKDLTFILKNLANSNSPPIYLIQGSSGIGKSSVIRDVFSSTEYSLITPPPLSMINSEDLVGVPFPSSENNYYEYLPPKWLKLKIDEATQLGKRIVIFWDEINRSSKDIRNSLLAAFDFSNPRLGDITLPLDTIHICASNPANYADVGDLGEALLGRMVLLDVIPDLESWLSWAEKSHIHPMIVSFIEKNPELLYTENEEYDDNSPSPRNWDKLSKVLSSIEGIFDNKELLHILFSSCVGDLAWIQFKKFIEDKAQLPSVIDLVITGKEFPHSTEDRILMSNRIVHWLKFERLNKNSIMTFFRNSMKFPMEIMLGIILPSIVNESLFKDIIGDIIDEREFELWAECFITPYRAIKNNG